MIRIMDVEFMGNDLNRTHLGRVLDRVARKCDSLMTPTKAGGAQRPTGSCRHADRIDKALRYR